MLSALKIPGFRWVAFLYAFDYLVELAAAIALMVLVYDATDSPIAASAMLFCKQVVPGAAMALIAKYLERVKVRTGLVAAYSVAGAATGVLAVLGYGVTLFVVAFIAGVTGSIVRALLRVAIARSLEGDERRAANGLLNVLMGAIALAGPAVGGILLALMEARTALIAMAIGSFLLALTSAAMPRALAAACAQPGAEDDEEDDEEPASEHHSAVPVWSLLAVGGLTLGLFAMDEPALLAYARDSLGSDVDGYATILIAWGVGMLLGGVAYARLISFSMAAVFGWGAALGAAGYVGLGLAPTLVVAVIVAVIGGAGNGVYWVALVTAVQESAADHQQAQAAARLEGIATATPAIGVIIGGVVAELVSPRASLLIPGALALTVLALWGLAIRALVTRPEPVAEPIGEPLAAGDLAA